MNYINKSEFKQIKNLLESKLNAFSNRGQIAFHDSIKKLGGQEMSDLAKCIYNSSVWGPNEQPDTTAMFPHYRKYSEKPKWNIGSFGSVWMDCVIGKDKVRLAFYYDLKTHNCHFKIDELDGGQNVYMNVLKKSNGGSNYTPKKKRRK